MEGHLTLEKFESYLKTRRLGRAQCANEVWPTIASTNDRALELAKAPSNENVIILSRQQTAGRGRQGRTWVSPQDAGIYATFLLKPQIKASDLPMMSLMAGVAAARAIEDVAHLTVGLKWVNDLVMNGKKLGGILAEVPGSLAAGESPYVVLGIGLNLRRPSQEEIPEEIRNVACWLNDVRPDPIDANWLAGSLANFMEEYYLYFLDGRWERIHAEWRHYSVTLGRQITVVNGNQTFQGEAISISDHGALVVKLADGTTQNLHSGEITIRNADGSYS